MSEKLPTPAEAMAEAIRYARSANSIDPKDREESRATARLWLDIARELRQGGTAPPARFVAPPVAAPPPPTLSAAERLRALDESSVSLGALRAEDRIYGYVRGQSPMPTARQYSAAVNVLDSPAVPGAAKSLAQEVVARWDAARALREASLTQPSRDETAYVARLADLSERLPKIPRCAHCGEDIYRSGALPGDPYVHRLSGQRVCQRPNLLGDNDSTMVHTYAEPTTA